MAQIDFSNATIEYITTAPNEWNQAYLMLNSSALWNSSNSLINQNAAVNKTSETGSKVSFVYTGTFTSAGTEFYFRSYFEPRDMVWKVSNISFDSGDTYGFQIDLELVIT